jgi:oligoribonuclease NrnB/cAMP/cGMP phosphodiesterase (DHH superfamily)
MPIKVTTIDKLTPHRRNKKSMIQALPEFQEVLQKLAVGLKPNEAIEVSLPKSEQRGFRYLRTVFKRYLLQHLKRLKLDTEYSIDTHSHEGVDYIVVSYAPALTKADTAHKGKRVHRKGHA